MLWGLDWFPGLLAMGPVWLLGTPSYVVILVPKRIFVWFSLVPEHLLLYSLMIMTAILEGTDTDRRLYLFLKIYLVK